MKIPGPNKNKTKILIRRKTFWIGNITWRPERWTLVQWRRRLRGRRPDEHRPAQSPTDGPTSTVRSKSTPLSPTFRQFLVIWNRDKDRGAADQYSNAKDFLAQYEQILMRTCTGFIISLTFKNWSLSRHNLSHITWLIVDLTLIVGWLLDGGETRWGALSSRLQS